MSLMIDLPPEVTADVTDRTLAPYAEAARQHAAVTWASWQASPKLRPVTAVDEENARQWIRLVFLRALYQGLLRENPLAREGDRVVLSPFVDLVDRYTVRIENLQTLMIHGSK